MSNINKIYAKKYINNSMAASLYRYAHYYDSLETDINVETVIDKDKDIIVLLNNKYFSFISEINIEFRNDFDNKIYLDNLPFELNNLIEKHLIDEKSIDFNLFNLDILYDMDYVITKINKDLISCKLKFYLKDEYLKNIKNYEDISEFINQIPNYLINNNDYGIKISSNIKRYLNIIITYMNYNNEAFHIYKEKYINGILSS